MTRLIEGLLCILLYKLADANSIMDYWMIKKFVDQINIAWLEVFGNDVALLWVMITQIWLVEKIAEKWNSTI